MGHLFIDNLHLSFLLITSRKQLVFTFLSLIFEVTFCSHLNPPKHLGKTVAAKLYCQTSTKCSSDSDWKMHTSMWGIKGKEEFSSNNRARQVSSLVNQRAARSTALKHVWDDALSIPCNYCPSPTLHILSDHQEYFYCMNVSCWNNICVIVHVRVCVCGQERKSKRSDVYIPPPWV